MGIILSAMAAAGDAGVQSMNQNIEQQNKLDLQNSMAQLALAKEKFIEDSKNAPLNRFGAIVQQKADEDVPVTAAPVTSATGMVSDNPDASKGFQGNYQAIRDQLVKGLKNNPNNQDAADALKQLDDQFLADQQKAQDAVAGQTRKRPTLAAIEAALVAAKARDLPAYAAAKAALGDKYLTVPDGASVIDTATGQPIFASTGKQDRQDQLEDRKDARQSAAEDARAARQDKTIAAAISRRDALSELTPAMEVNAQAIAKGQLPPITGFGLRSPGAAATMARVLELNPDYSAKDYGTGSKAEKDFATGKQGNSVRSFNVAIAHLNTLGSLSDALDNGDVKAINQIGNLVATQTGATAPVNFEAAKHIVADEIVKAVTGSAGALGDREAAAKTVDAANSPAQLRGVITTYKELMNGQLNGLRHQYKATTGRDDFDSKYLSDDAKAMNHPPATPASAPGMPSDISDLLKKYGG